MKNVTLAIDDQTLEAGREYARQHGTTLNNLVRELLTRHAGPNRAASVDEMFRLMDAHPGDSKGRRWQREDLYAR